MTANYWVFAGDQWLEKTLTLKGNQYRVVSRDGGAGIGLMAFALEGRKAKVYKLDSSNGHAAFKVFFKKYAILENMISMLQLKDFSSVPGLRVCRREVVDEKEASGVHEPGLAFAILMPWIDGTAWAEIIIRKQDLGEPECIALASATAAVLSGLERRQLAHADISSSNVIVQIDRNPPGVELIDVEDMYHPRFVPVPFPPDGSPGYGHPSNQGKGCCNEYGDRFAGAVLLAEMLTWHEPRIREMAEDGYFFSPKELCKPGQKYNLMLDALSAHSSSIASLFERAWHSDGLADCPTLASWQASLSGVHPAAKRIGRPELFLSLGPSPSYFDLLSGGALQAKIAPSTVCSECGNRIKASTPPDHAHSCSHHPDNFRPGFGLQRSFAEWSLDKKSHSRSSSIAGLGLALRKYSPRLTICSECQSLVCGDDDEAHTDTCSKKKVKLVGAALWLDPSLIRSPVSGSSERCDECKRAIYSDQDHSPSCSKHPSVSLRKDRFHDVSFVPFANTTPPSWLQSTLSSPNSSSECGGIVHRSGNLEFGHKPRCSKAHRLLSGS